MSSKDWIRLAVSESEVPEREESDRPTAGYLIVDEDSGIRIRKATEKDASVLAAIGARAFYHGHFGVLGLSSLAEAGGRFDVTTLRRELREENAHALLGMWESSPVGFAQVRSGTTHPFMPEELTLELHGLYVAPDWARHGVGSTLVRGALALADELGFESLWCGVLAANRGAVSFCESSGFRCVGRERKLIGRRHRLMSILSRPVHATLKGTSPAALSAGWSPE